MKVAKNFKVWCKERSSWDSLQFPFVMLLLGPVALITLVSLALWSHSESDNLQYKDPMFESIDST